MAILSRFINRRLHALGSSFPRRLGNPRYWSSSSESRSDTPSSRAPLCWLDLRGSRLSILERLLLEECLLHIDPARSWMIVGCHDASSHRLLDRNRIPSASSENPSVAIVMGIGGKPRDLLHVENVQRDQILLIKRFSGGGTVVMDPDAIWTTIIGRSEHFPQIPAFPRPLMQFTSDAFFEPLFHRLYDAQRAKEQSNAVIPAGEQKTLVYETKSCAMDNSGRVRTVPHKSVTILRGNQESISRSLSAQSDYLPFNLRENDYVLGESKIGGNAQSITGKGWLHHTSFLWDYQSDNMHDYLRLPPKRPEYRQNRSHSDFLIKLRRVYPHLTKSDFFRELKEVCRAEYILQEVNHGEVIDMINQTVGGLHQWWDTKSRTRIVKDIQ